jgi:hypothetical protein
MSRERIPTVDLLEQGIAALQAMGYQLRIEPEIGRSMICTVKGKSWLVLDPNQAPRDQLQVVLDGLRAQTASLACVPLSHELRRVVEFHARAA